MGSIINDSLSGLPDIFIFFDPFLANKAKFLDVIDYRSKSKHPTDPRLVAYESSWPKDSEPGLGSSLGLMVSEREPKTCARGTPQIG